MSEINQNHETSEQQSRATAFIGDHIHVPHELQGIYHEVQVAKVEEKLATGDMSPVWIRRTFEMGSEFGATIDCYVPDPASRRILLCGYIDFDGRDIEVVVPAEDGSRVPVLEKVEAFSAAALCRAIERIEHLAQELSHS